MRRRKGWIALAAVALVGGCARPAPPREVVVAPVRGRAVVERAPVVPCKTTDLVLATVSQCGDGGLKLGVAAE